MHFPFLIRRKKKVAFSISGKSKCVKHAYFVELFIAAASIATTVASRSMQLSDE